MSKNFKQLVDKFNSSEEKRLKNGKNIAEFRPGDKINVEFKQAGLSRTSIFTGTCIRIVNKKQMSSFTVIKLSKTTQIVKNFLFCSPSLISISIKKAAVRHRRAKLFYLIKKDSNHISRRR